ncbi:protein ADM2 [Ornithorhynchus anatinus]|uniref:protein ADM2 n=1 Tax=Ornithorhynchus anatinus TaxID=9258 RepID=UPI0010A83306|nr:protein ADM2 [Ornithorhynchus anatinus]XP_028934362.1 protein ADM2 [Ornithorhynchus anatinus]
MGWTLPLALGCISLLGPPGLPGLPLPGGSAQGAQGPPLLTRRREPPDRPGGPRSPPRLPGPLRRPTATPPRPPPPAGPARPLRTPRAPRGRGRRHAGPRRHHVQLMRVGCALGTCQVQNLSHRLWQLMGQSGRRDSSPMDPNSPHSYG